MSVTEFDEAVNAALSLASRDAVSPSVVFRPNKHNLVDPCVSEAFSKLRLHESHFISVPIIPALAGAVNAFKLPILVTTTRGQNSHAYLTKSVAVSTPDEDGNGFPALSEHAFDGPPVTVYVSR